MWQRMRRPRRLPRGNLHPPRPQLTQRPRRAKTQLFRRHQARPKKSQFFAARARVVANMSASLEVPTATSVRAVPAKLLIDNRIVINNHLGRRRGGKVSFTHLLGYAIVKAPQTHPEMNCAFADLNGKPAVVHHDSVNFGLAIDLPKPDGTRQLLVPNIKDAQRMDFAKFWTSYDDLVRRARQARLGVDDFAGTTISLTNPGTLGTVHSVPRLMLPGQGAIVGAGALGIQLNGKRRPLRRWPNTG